MGDYARVHNLFRKTVRNFSYTFLLFYGTIPKEVLGLPAFSGVLPGESGRDMYGTEEYYDDEGTAE